MCGRFTLRLTPQELQSIFDLLRAFEEPLKPRYNIAPTQAVIVVRDKPIGRVADWMHWGLIPSWSKDRKRASSLINARSETLTEKPSFRSAFKKRRCLIPADGFIEWKAVSPKTKQPYLITLKGEMPFAFAGLWECWHDPESNKEVESCTIITTSANELLSDLHERMPVILPESAWSQWNDPEETDPEKLQKLLLQYPAEQMELRPISTLVNSVRNDDVSCLKSPQPTLFGSVDSD